MTLYNHEKTVGDIQCWEAIHIHLPLGNKIW